MTAIKIDSNIPIPPHTTRKNQRWPILDLKVGESFALKEKDRVKVATRCYQIHQQHKLQKNPPQYTVRKYGDDYRCWRIK